MKKKTNKPSARERQYGIGKQKKRPEDTIFRYLWLINYGERTSSSTLALGHPLLSRSRHVRTYYYYCMSYSSSEFLCSDPFRHETFRPLFRRLAPFPLVLGCSRLLVSVDTESSEVAQEIPHPLFLLPPQGVHAPHQFSEHSALRQSLLLSHTALFFLLQHYYST